MATDKTHKTNGVFYLRRIYLRTKKNPNAKFISLSMEQAGKIIEGARVDVTRLQDQDGRLVKFRNQLRIDSTLWVGVHPFDIIGTETE